MDGWMDVEAGLRIAYSNQKFELENAELLNFSFEDGKLVSKNGDVDVAGGDDDEEEDFKVDEIRPQPWYFHIVASFILVVHGFTFLVPQDSDSDDTDMMRTIGKWFGFDWEWMKPFTPYAQVIWGVR